jgi:hypothetical protein
VLIFVKIPGGALIYSLLGLIIFADFTMRDFQQIRRSRNISTSSAPLPEGRVRTFLPPDYGASRTCELSALSVRIDIRPVHVAARPYSFGPSNTALVEWVAGEAAHDGTRIHVEGVAVIEIRGRRVVHIRDYVFDSSPLEVMWGPPTSTAEALSTMTEPGAAASTGARHPEQVAPRYAFKEG